eukprot:gene11294-23633_t
MKLFVEFQIPSDLFSFDGDDVNASAAERLAVVKSHVNAILQMLEEAKQQEVAAAKQKAQFEEPIVPLMATAATFTSGEGMHGRFDNSGRRSDIRYKTNRDIPLMDDMSIPHQQQQQPPLQKAFRGRVETSETTVQSQSAGSPVKPTATDYSLNDNDKSDDTATTTAIPYTSIPTAIDSIFSRLDPTAAVRPSILSPGEVWTKKAQAALLASPTASILTRDNQKTERQRAFDLLDALTRSGANPVDHASLHVVLASSHSFDKTIMDTIVQENVNPIERVERSLLIMKCIGNGVGGSDRSSETVLSHAVRRITEDPAYICTIKNIRLTEAENTLYICTHNIHPSHQKPSTGLNSKAITGGKNDTDASSAIKEHSAKSTTPQENPKLKTSVDSSQILRHKYIASTTITSGKIIGNKDKLSKTEGGDGLPPALVKDVDLELIAECDNFRWSSLRRPFDSCRLVTYSRMILGSRILCGDFGWLFYWSFYAINVLSFLRVFPAASLMVLR